MMARRDGGARKEAFALLAAAGIAASIWAFRAKRRRSRSHFLPTRRPLLGMATRFVPTYINRTSNGKIGGLQAFTVEDTGSDDMPFADLMQLDRIVLYCLDVEQQLLIFLRIQEGTDLLSLPFLDRGVRQLASAKDYVYVASFDTARDYLKQSRSALDPSSITFLWGTGRCGSTLLHRLLVQAGVCSLSEPFWYEQLARHATEKDPSEAGQILELCCGIDFPLTRKVLSTEHTGHRYALGGKAFAHSLLEPVIYKYPEASHLFMYRDVVEVVESFQSIFVNDVPWWSKLYYLYFSPPPATARGITSDELRKRFERGELPIPFKRSAARNALMWLDSVCTWLEVNKSYPLRTMTIRMKEVGGRHTIVTSLSGCALIRAPFRTIVTSLSGCALIRAPFVTPCFLTQFIDPQRRQAVVKEVLSFVFNKEYRESSETTARCLKVFGTHSQQGDRMQRSSSHPGVAKALNRWDAKQIRRLVEAALPEVAQSGLLPHTAFREADQQEQHPEAQ